MSESDPTGRKPKEPGAKLDAGKPPIEKGFLSYFPNAVAAVAEVSQFGASKYSWNGWETVPDGVERYSDALARHLVAEARDAGFENRHTARDADSGLLHAAHAAWCAMAKLELILRAQDPYEEDAL